MTTQTITKETVHNIRFSDSEIFSNEVEKVRRKLQLEKALKLGNLYKQQVCIYFQDADGAILKTVATVWAVTENHVVLKSHIMIPINRIVDVDLVTHLNVA